MLSALRFLTPLGLAVGAVVSLSAQGSVSSPSTSEGITLDPFPVVGTRLVSPSTRASPNVIVLDEAFIQRSGATDLAGLVNLLPPNLRRCGLRPRHGAQRLTDLRHRHFVVQLHDRSRRLTSPNRRLVRRPVGPWRRPHPRAHRRSTAASRDPGRHGQLHWRGFLRSLGHPPWPDRAGRSPHQRCVGRPRIRRRRRSDQRSAASTLCRIRAHHRIPRH